MNTIETFIKAYEFNRVRTLALLDKIAADGEARKIVGWRPGTGRAHIAWQLTHLGITEQLFATERLVPGTKPAFADLVPRFKGGSTPDDDIPPVDLVRRVLTESRAALIQTLSRFSESDLTMKPEAFKERNWTLHDVLHVLAWHEPHHQGQAHITLNLYNAARAS
jgi:hypothetical protein